MDERGIDLLLLVALQVSVERTSFLPKFLITSSFRATPFLTVTVLLLTSFSSRYQDTVGVGLPERKKRFPPNFQKYFFLISYSLDRGYFYLALVCFERILWLPWFFLSPFLFCPLPFPLEWKRMEWDSFVSSSFVFSVPRYDGFYEEESRLYRELMNQGIEMNRNADNAGDIFKRVY